MSLHAREARRLLEEVRHVDSDNVAYYASDADQIAAAQVEATLALVEQVRISNIVAIVNVDPFVDLGEGGKLVDAALVETVGDGGWGDERQRHLRPEIAAELGIGFAHV